MFGNNYSNQLARLPRYLWTQEVLDFILQPKPPNNDYWGRAECGHWQIQCLALFNHLSNHRWLLRTCHKPDAPLKLTWSSLRKPLWELAAPVPTHSGRYSPAPLALVLRLGLPTKVSKGKSTEGVWIYSAVCVWWGEGTVSQDTGAAHV